jgi:predicted NAD-dependent protein-ADP-ribosyltransferase YbiA (DUF1768 family)
MRNSHRCRVVFLGREFPSVEHAFLAARSMHPADHRAIAECRYLPKARRVAAEITMVRPFWSRCRLGIMLGLLESKFSDPVLGRKLVKTHPRPIVANGFDPYWETDWRTDYGENKLGILLTIVRDNLRLNRGTPYNKHREYARNKVRNWRAKTRTKGKGPHLPSIPKLPWYKGYDFGHERRDRKEAPGNPAIHGRWTPTLDAEVKARVTKELAEYERKKTAKRPHPRRVARLPKSR